MKVYNKNYLLEVLEKKGLTHSKPKIIELEKGGVIPKGSVEVVGDNHKWRFYTDEDIEKVIEHLEAYGDKRRKQESETES